MSVSKPDRRKYDDAFKAEALRLAVESHSTRAAAGQLGISEKLLYRWQQAQTIAEVGSVEQAQDPAYRALRAENQRLERELCRVLQVAPSAYYAWWQRRQRPAPTWERAVCRAFARHARRYGTRRLRAELQAAGYQIGRYRIRPVLHQHGLRAQQPRSSVPRTINSGHGQRVAPNRLLGQPRPTQPDRVWVGDITCLPKQNKGWLYLASWQDTWSRKIVGWGLRETMPEDLVSEALRRSLAVRQPAAGLLVHSDQGSQYTATRFRALLADRGAAQSMSRRGNCYDNAQAKSFWSRLKTELLDGGSFAGLTEARLEVAHYIAYYNDERRHSSLDYQSPNHFETHFQPTSQLCPA